jgi:subtilisin family serine protease
LAQFGDIYIASIPLNRLSDLSLNRQVQRIEAGERHTALMDTTYIINKVEPVYQGTGLPQAYTGKGVIVGVEDIGFDLTHPNFYDASMENYRIKRFWDQLSVDTLDSELYVGADYTTQEEILRYAHSRDGLTQGHGTHTLGIAAGSGFDTPFRGIAYESDICLVSNAVTDDKEYIDSVNYYKYTSATDALGFKYILDYAESQGKPCVVSFSEGSHQDFSGDDQLLYEVLEQMVGPGKIIVASAGNEGGLNSYFHKSPEQVSEGTFLNRYDKTYFFRVIADKPMSLRFISYKSATRADTLMISSDQIFSAPDSLLKDTTDLSNKQHIFEIGAYPFSFDESRTVYEVGIKSKERFGYAGYFFSVEIVGEGVEADFYTGTGSIGAKKEYNAALTEGERTHCVYSPGTAPAVICVGASAYRTGIINHKGNYINSNRGQNGEVADYSSVGPTVDGRIKPDVLANGTNVVSSYSSFYREEHPTSDGWDITYSTFQGRSYPWRIDIGTSMSTPVVSGIIALWLQARPDLTPEEIKDVIAQTSIRHDPTLDYPNNSYGWGEIDAYRGLLYLLGLSGIKEITSEQPRKVQVVLQDDCMRLCFYEPLRQPLDVALYGVGGSLVARHHLNSGTTEQQVGIGGLPTGVYAVQLHSQQPGITGSFLIRKPR